MTRDLLPSVVLFALIASVPTSAGQSASIEWIELGTPDGPDAGGATSWSVEPHAMNAQGDVAGAYLRTIGEATYVSAFVWNRAHGFTIISDNGIATDINDRGDVVGVWWTCGPPMPSLSNPCRTDRGFRWSAARGLVDLGTTIVPAAINNGGRMVGYCEPLGGYCYRRSATTIRRLPAGFIANDLNERGVVAGSYEPGDQDGQIRAALWMSTTGVRTLDRSPDLEDNTARAINESSMAVGHGSGTEAETTIPLLFTPFGSVRGPFTNYGIAHGISDRGWIVGVIDAKPVVWRMGKGVTRLPLPDANASGAAYDVNDDGFVVGIMESEGVTRALVWLVK
jgi:uncharacterized membrane protein